MTAHATTVITDVLSGALAAHANELATRWTRARDTKPEDVHRGRVASRRVREALAIADAAGLGGPVSDLRHEIRRVTKALGPVREIDVAFEELDLASARHVWPAEAVSTVRMRLQKERDSRARRLKSKMKTGERAVLKASAATIVAALSESRADRRWWRALAVRVSRRARKVVEAVAACGTIYAPERLHELRIAIKKLRYTLEVVGEIPGVRVGSLLAQLKTAQQQLGHLHDIHVLIEQIQTLAARKRPHRPHTSLRRMTDALERDCRELHARLLPHLPGLADAVTLARQDIAARARGDHLAMAKVQPRATSRRDRPGTRDTRMLRVVAR